jgi:hypothetical protein
MKVQGAEFNPETGGEHLQEKTFDFCGTMGFRTVCFITCTRYIMERIRPSDWDRFKVEVGEFQQQRIDAALREGWVFDRDAAFIIDTATERYAKEWVYNHFMKQQEKAGNESWVVPPTLEAVNV